MKNNKYRVVLLVIALVFNLGILYIFKYAKFNLILPIGISFYTFQILSYIIDVYFGKIKPEKNFISLSTYIIMFPQLIAGPIIRYKDITKDINKERVFNKENLYSGIKIFIFGLSSKVIIANQLSAVGLDVSSFGLETMTCLTAFLDAIAYTLQIYFDFFGYSLMAIGLGKMMGINIMKNFDEPYKSVSITEFWRRWHISLGNWFRDYLYIPLGGNRVGVVNTCINLFIVFTLSGIWHGATRNYMFWGMYFGILIIIERLFLYKFLEKNRIIGHIYLLLAVTISFVIFKNENLNDMALYFKRMFDFSNIAENNNFYTIVKANYKAILLGIICITNVPNIIVKYIDKNKVVQYIVVILLFILSVYLIYSGYNDPFMYFRF